MLVPAALDGAITRHNAAKIRARMIVEGANGPTTAEVDEILGRQGVTVVPDILANAGGVTVSYYEWVQNMQHFRWERADTVRHLEKALTSAFLAVHETSKKHATSLRVGALVLGVDRVATAVRLRGY